METALVRASSASPQVRRALRLVIIAGGATLAVGAALLQPFGASHLFPTQAGPATSVTALPPPPPPAAPLVAPRGAAQPPPPQARPATTAAAVPELRAVAPSRFGPPPPPREPLPLRTDLIEPAAPAEPSGAKAAAPAAPATGGAPSKPPAGDRHD